MNEVLKGVDLNREDDLWGIDTFCNAIFIAETYYSQSPGSDSNSDSD